MYRKGCQVTKPFSEGEKFVPKFYVSLSKVFRNDFLFKKLCFSKALNSSNVQTCSTQHQQLPLLLPHTCADKLLDGNEKKLKQAKFMRVFSFAGTRSLCRMFIHFALYCANSTSVWTGLTQTHQWLIYSQIGHAKHFRIVYESVLGGKVCALQTMNLLLHSKSISGFKDITLPVQLYINNSSSTGRVATETTESVRHETGWNITKTSHSEVFLSCRFVGKTTGH